MSTLLDRRKSLLQLVPEGVPVTRRWLMQAGFDRHALDNMLKSGQLEAVAQGVYTRPATYLTWQGIAFSLEGFTVGGLTALELQGFSHYLSLSDKKTIHLYGREALPTWVHKLLPDTVFLWHSEKEFTGRGITHKGHPLKAFTENYSWRDDQAPLTISSPERAYLEILMDVPDALSFEHADQLMQGLANLSPRRLTKLLKLCRNVKIRRLFYWLAERHNHQWFKKLPDPQDLDDLGLGSGNRMLAKGGRLNTKYRITIPEDMWQEP